MDGPAEPARQAHGDPGPSGLFEETRLRLADGDWERWTDAEFQRRAAAAFRHQFDTCAPYRALCRRRGVTPAGVASWEDVPLVPATAFKHFDFVSVEGASGSPEGASRSSAVFRTSGTTRGSGQRGRHHVPRLDLYDASLCEPFRRALLPELTATQGGALFVSLIPSPADAPDSSLSYMVNAAARRFAYDLVWLVDGDGAWRSEALERVPHSMADAGARGDPTLVLGTALAYLHLLESSGSRGEGPPFVLRDLPDGARLMETGGFKGVRRDVAKDELYRAIEGMTGIPRSRIVNEYGMTELLSQLYEPVLAEGGDAAGVHLPPPWLRVRALDPITLDPVAEGEEGILAFFDLANLGSVCHVLTEDVGSVVEGRVRLRGRAAGAEPRGCSRAMDELMSAARG